MGWIEPVPAQLEEVLSARELEVGSLVARGLSNKEVARQLGVSEGTAKGHVHRIFRKVGAKNRYGLISWFDTSNSTDQRSLKERGRLG